MPRSITYEDTERVYARYGEIDKLTEKSPNILVINNKLNKYSFILDQAKVYNLSDGSIVTGEVAEDNGVISFRFIGELNPNANWRNVNLKITSVYSIEEVYDTNIDVTDEFIDEEDSVLHQKISEGVNNSHNNVLFYTKDENNESD